MTWTRNKTLASLLFLIAAGHSSALPFSGCTEPLGRFARAVWAKVIPAQRTFSGAASADARGHWARLLQNPGIEPSQKAAAILADLEADPSLENHVALFDAIQARGTLLSGAIERLGESQNIATVSQNGRLPWSRAPTAGVRWSGVLLHRPSQLRYSLPQRPPRTLDEVGANLLTMAKGVRDAEAALLRHRSPIASLPFGRSARSYAKQLEDVTQLANDRDYAFVEEWNRTFPGNALKLSPHSARALSWWKAALRAPTLVLYPYYDPLANAGPNEPDYRRRQSGDNSSTDLGNQARLNYFASTLRRGLLATAVFGIFSSAVSTALFLASDDSRIARVELTNLMTMLMDPQAEAKLQKFSNRPEGSPAVNAILDDKVEKLRIQIRHTGDPDGAFKKEIQEIEELRESLKHRPHNESKAPSHHSNARVWVSERFRFVGGTLSEEGSAPVGLARVSLTRETHRCTLALSNT